MKLTRRVKVAIVVIIVLAIIGEIRGEKLAPALAHPLIGWWWHQGIGP